MEWIQVLRDVSVLIGAWVAIYGINSWRREHAGKRRLELAEDALVLFYEARDTIRYIRSPISSSSETEHVEQGKNETKKDWEARKKASVVFKRHNEYQELFSKLHAMRYRFMARFGKKEAEPFEELRRIRNKLLSSARSLARLWAQDEFGDEQDREAHYTRVREREAVFWDDGGDGDPINPQLDALIGKMEKTCNAVISGRSSLWGRWKSKVCQKNRDSCQAKSTDESI